MSEHFDFAILGAGVAGVVTACELQRLGHQVVLVHAPRRMPAIEGLAERTRRGLSHVGCHRALATVSDPVPRTAEWNGASFDGNREHLVDRAVFDRALLEDARAAGVAIEAIRVKRVSRTSDGWAVDAGRGAAGDIRAGYLVDARGRGAAKCGVATEAGPGTFGIGRMWRLREPAVSHAHIKTFSEGWAWLAVLGDRAQLQVFVSVEGARLPPKSALAGHYANLLQALPDCRRFLATAEPDGPVFARTAQITFCPSLADDHQARVGEAALTIDPLAGHGMFEAVGGGLALAATLNTLRRFPERREVALAFYRDKMRHDFQRMARTARDFYRLEERWTDRPFWQERWGWPDDEPSHAELQAGSASVERRAVNDDGTIVERDVLVTADHPRGVWQLAGVELVALMRFADGREGTSANDLADRAATELGVPVDSVQQALMWLRMRGVLLQGAS